jgi:transaldolase
MEREGIEVSEINKVIKEICCILPNKPVSVELLDSEREKEILIEEAVNYSQIDPNVVVKVPTIGDGRHLEIIKILSEKKIKVNSTLNITSEQLILAAISGAKYVSIFFNRVKDAEEDPQLHIERMANFISKNNFDTRIIVGSIRKPTDIVDALSSGAHIVTVPPNILEAAVFHPKSEETRKEFDEQGKRFLQIISKVE